MCRSCLARPIFGRAGVMALVQDKRVPAFCFYRPEDLGRSDTTKTWVLYCLHRVLYEFRYFLFEQLCSYFLNIVFPHQRLKYALIKQWPKHSKANTPEVYSAIIRYSSRSRLRSGATLLARFVGLSKLSPNWAASAVRLRGCSARTQESGGEAWHLSQVGALDW